MQQKNTKSATTAGLLGIFLGAIGAHNWYLGEKKKGIIHVCIATVGVLMTIIASAIMVNSFNIATLLTGFSPAMIFQYLGEVIVCVSATWGLIEGIRILIDGDAGLAQKGYITAVSAPMQQGYPMQGQPSHNVQQQPLYQQPQDQPAMHIPKQPMDPAKKKKLILMVLICSCALIFVIVAVIIALVISRVDYQAAYETAKELKPALTRMRQGSEKCESIIEDVTNGNISMKIYDGYIEECKNAYNDEIDKLIAKLENTDGVKRNDEIKLQFNKFKSEYASVIPDVASLSQKLSLWQAFHNYTVAVSDMDCNSSDAEFRTTVNYLTNSGNEVLKAYGEGWLAKTMEVVTVCREHNSMRSGAEKTAKRKEYDKKLQESGEWVASNKPDIKAVAPLNFKNMATMDSEFNKLYKSIAETYEKNYNRGSGDCTEFLGEVICD